ncbi:glycosyltransferase family 2 protein [Winogradskyella rapida]|uniref:Glycosyltransferase family 2 protein n=1 Tax=Winogradskyella rapida TaxID=549701 RepID=A0ABW3KT08_9FLAO
MQSNPKASVIISTYNKPLWLGWVLHSYTLQTEQNFEIIIADDGSDARTKAVIEQFASTSNLKISHVWQEDQGFQKTRILNKAIVASNSEYLIFTDGDCLARKDFVETHLRLRQKHCALSGGYFKMADSITSHINTTVISEQKCFEKDWLIEMGQPSSFKLNKLTRSKTKSQILNWITPTKATFDGMNVSCYKMAIVDVNGFDERMQYGGLDREVGERMMNNGIKFIQVRYSTICVHLHHERPYKTDKARALNEAIRTETKRKKKKWSPYGIKQ